MVPQRVGRLINLQNKMNLIYVIPSFQLIVIQNNKILFRSILSIAIIYIYIYIIIIILMIYNIINSHF